MRLCFYYSRQFETTFHNSHWRKNVQMQPMRICIKSGTPLETTFENSHWRKGIQMQPMRLCIKWVRPLETTFENSHWRKIIEMQPMRQRIHPMKQFEGTFKSHSLWAFSNLSSGPSMGAAVRHVGKFLLYLVFEIVADSDSDSMHGFLCFLRFLVYWNTFHFPPSVCSLLPPSRAWHLNFSW